MDRLGGTGWLWIGAVLAIAVPLSGIHRWILDGVGTLLPVPWLDVIVGTSLLLLGVALYFRSHWIATARALRRVAEEAHDGGSRVTRLADEIDNSGFVIRDNLEEIVPGMGEASERERLFLDGAIAHARRLETLARRCRGLGSRLGTPAAEEGSEVDGRASEKEG